MACNFFHNLYTEDSRQFTKYHIRGKFNPISHVLLNNLSKPVSIEDIRNALFETKPWKALGLNGFHASFFQKNWGIVGDKVYEEVRKVLAGAPLTGNWNHTLITLIPMVATPVIIANFHPTSLCSVLYKIITKVLSTGSNISCWT